MKMRRLCELTESTAWRQRNASVFLLAESPHRPVAWGVLWPGYWCQPHRTRRRL